LCKSVLIITHFCPLYEGLKWLIFNCKTKQHQMFTVKIPCKPYVRRYIQTQFGTPATLDPDKVMAYFFRLLLQRKFERNEKNISLSLYTSEVEVAFSEDVFNRYGHSLNKTAISQFNNFTEQYIKQQARAMIKGMIGYNDNLTQCVREFQKDFGFTEDDFPIDTIKKDIQRRADFFQDFFGKDVPNFGRAVPYNNEQ
jgi:hypothetical protein